MKERAKTIWMGNGFGIEFVVGDPWVIDILLIPEKDPTLTDNNMKTIASSSIHRKGEWDDKGNWIQGSEEPMRAFAERARLEALEWAEAEIAEYKETEELTTIMGEVLDSSE